jgi:hypothetical protein
MHTVVETPSYLAAAKAAGMSAATRAEIVSAVASDPTTGDLLQGTHGLRKLRHARPGSGKSGGFRVITFYHSPALPVFLITVFGKNEKANLSRAEANALGEMVKAMAANYQRRSKK